jgi:hypothetical protein
MIGNDPESKKVAITLTKFLKEKYPEYGEFECSFVTTVEKLEPNSEE